MVVKPSEDSRQSFVSVSLDSAVGAGTTLHSVDAADDVVAANFVTGKATQNVVFSSDAITYTVYAGGTASGTSTGGLTTGDELSS